MVNWTVGWARNRLAGGMGWLQWGGGNGMMDGDGVGDEMKWPGKWGRDGDAMIGGRR